MPIRTTPFALLAALLLGACETRIVTIDCIEHPESAGCPDAGVGGGGTGGDSGTSGVGATGGSGGVDGGGAGGMTGGSGGDGSVASCTQDSECDAEHPQCNGSGECGPCTSPRACEGRIVTTRCELTANSANRGECVQCTAAAHCTGAADKCVQNECVECEDSSDCPEDKPQCGAGVCGACTGNAACTGRAETLFCNTASTGAHAGQCLACTTHGQCDNPSPQCNAAHECEACTGNAACADRADATVCDLSTAATFAGTCVQCTGTQYARCEVGAMPFVCQSLTRTCSSSALEHSRDACGECVSDAQCQAGKLCVRQTFNDPEDSPDQGALEVGYFCAWRLDAADGPDGDCFSERPYVDLNEEAPSVDGTQADVCLLGRTTCPALADYLSKDCESTSAPGTADDALCGDPDLAHDGYCVAAGASTFRCTTPCAGDDDCKVGFECNSSTDPDICSL